MAAALTIAMPLAPSGPADETGARNAVPLVDWLVDCALPMWAGAGVDRSGGGFFEKIDLEGRAVEEPRRARVVARQIYVFATAARRGWLDHADALVEHGLHFLFSRMRLADGTFAASVRPDGTVVDDAFDLYEHAFILFALAAACRDRPDRDARLRGEAEGLLKRIRDGWGHPLAGFEESAPRTLPLKSNPHMHLLEAAMAWADISSGSARDGWQALCDELVDLCLDRFVDPGSGALREYFDGEWRPMPDSRGRIVEPGHQFEWAWLLMRHAGSFRQRHLTAAARLLAIGETHGIDRSRGVAVDVLDDGFRVTGEAAKLWPQTERIKAWHAARASANDPRSALLAEASLRDAVDGLSRYLLASPPGLWHEQMLVDGGFAPQPCRASSLYHIVCAIDVLAGDAGTSRALPA